QQQLRLEVRCIRAACGEASCRRRHQLADRVIRRHCSYDPRMPQPLFPPAGPQTIGQVLDTGFRIFQVSLVRCLLYGAAGMIAGQLPNIYTVLASKSLGRTDFRDPAWVALYLVSALVSIIIYGALVLRQYSIVTGRRRGMRAEIRETLRRFPSIF